MSNKRYILKMTCPNRPGIVSAVSTHLFEHGCNILEASQFDDTGTGRFFVRLEFNFVEAGGSIAALRDGFEPIAERYAMDWSIRDTDDLQRVMLMVSKFDHC